VSDSLAASSSNGSVGHVGLPALQALVAEVLGTDIPAHGSFIGHGGDSFQAVVLIGLIEDTWGVEVDFPEVLASTPESLAQAVNTALDNAARK
jgi:acyl carrier protein